MTLLEVMLLVSLLVGVIVWLYGVWNAEPYYQHKIPEPNNMLERVPYSRGYVDASKEEKE